MAKRKSSFKIARWKKGKRLRSYYEDSLRMAVSTASKIGPSETHILYKHDGGKWKKLKVYSYKNRSLSYRSINGGIAISRSRKMKRKYSFR